jgi:pyruvate dehydrogenase E2 component (dihydrolipoyllysine-residue acetyltransferase)
MSVSVTLPALGESVTEGTVTRWLKQEGDTVAADEPLLEVSTDKVDTEIPAPAAGVLTSIKVREDETVAVGTELAVIDSDGAQSADAPADTAQSAPAPEQAAPPAPESAAEPTATEEPTTEELATTEQPAAQQPAATEQPSAEEPAATEQPSAEEPAATEQPAQEAAPPAQEAAPPAQEAAPEGGGQTASVVLPALGESVTEGTVTRWLKQEGDTVAADEPLLEVSTDKVDTEIPAPTAGVLTSIKVREDETVAVGTELAVISTGAAAGAAPDGTEPAQPASAPAPPAEQAAPAEPAAAEPTATAPPIAQPQAAQAEPAPPAQSQAPPPAPTETAAPAPAVASKVDGGSATATNAYVTPLVRKLATEHGVDLSSLRGTGVGGRIRKQDVLDAADAAAKAREAAAAQPAPAATASPAASKAAAPESQVAAPSPLRGRTEKMSRLRQVIAKRMVESLQTSAQLTTVVEVDVTKIARLRERAKRDFAAREGVKLSYLPFFAVAAVEALKSFPMLNALIDTERGEVTYHDAEHLGIAVDTERGLLVPVIKNAGDLNLAGIARKIADLAERTRSNKIGPDDLAGGTFTLTNTGSRGALFDTPIINQPQVAILGTGSVVKRAVVVDDPDLGETIAIRSMAYLALTYDHRLVDGADAARFLAAVKKRLEEGRFEAALGLTG